MTSFSRTTCDRASWKGLDALSEPREWRSTPFTTPVRATRMKGSVILVEMFLLRLYSVRCVLLSSLSRNGCNPRGRPVWEPGVCEAPGPVWSRYPPERRGGMDPSAHGLQWWLPTHRTVSIETFSSIVKKFSLREDCVQCKSKEAKWIAVSQLEAAVYSGSTDVGHAPWHWSMVISFTDDGLSFFQLSSLLGCRPRAGERLWGQAGWSHRWGQQGAAGAFRAGCQRLRLPEAAFKPWKSSALQEWLGKATSVQDPDSVRCQLWSRTAEVWWKEG